MDNGQHIPDINKNYNVANNPFNMDSLSESGTPKTIDQIDNFSLGTENINLSDDMTPVVAPPEVDKPRQEAADVGLEDGNMNIVDFGRIKEAIEQKSGDPNNLNEYVNKLSGKLKGGEITLKKAV